MDVTTLTIHAAKDALARGEMTSVELTRKVLDRIDAVEPKVNAFITRTSEEAMAQAVQADAMRSRGEGGPLCGIPLGIKDVICTKGIRTTAGSKILKDFISPYDATVMEKLNSQGAVCVGKLSMDEFAMGSGNENCAFGTPHNPWNLDYICGGSSGGSAASVAAGECLASLGSDTGGSIRQPASHCGVVGVKPTYGRVSRFGLLAFASSLDQIGPLTRDVTDAALMLNGLAGHDPRDSTSSRAGHEDYTEGLLAGMKGLTIGIPTEYFGAGLSLEVEKVIRHGIAVLQDAGAEVKEVSLPHTEYGVAAYYIIAPAEASSNLARYDGVRYTSRDMDADSLIDLYRRSRSQGFGDEVKRRILLGTYALSSGYYDAYYKKASQVRTLIVEDYKNVFKECDVLVSPVTPTPAWKIGEKASDPLSVYLSDALTIPANLAGVPGMSVPCGFSASGLPIGMQLQAAHFAEKTLFRAGFNLEQGLGIQGKQPSLS